MTKRSVEERLDLFIEQVEKMQSRRFYACSHTFRLTYLFEGPAVYPEVYIDVPDKDDFQAFLVDFRHFMMPSGDLEFVAITDHLQERLADNELIATSELNRRRWLALFRLPTVISQRYDAAKLLRLVLNGEIFHKDQAKRAAYNALPQYDKALGEFLINTVVLLGAKVLKDQAQVIRAAQPPSI